MKKIWGKSAAFRTGGYQTSLLLLACCYAVGAIAGYVAYQLWGYALPVKTAAQWSAFLQYIWYYAKYLLIAFVCGYTALGLLVQPALLAAKGYFMCSAVVAAIASPNEIPASRILAENMIISFVSLCALFVLGGQGLRGAKNAFSAVTRRRGINVEPGFGPAQAVRFAICVVAIVIAGAVNIMAAPYLADLLLK